MTRVTSCSVPALSEVPKVCNVDERQRWRVENTEDGPRPVSPTKLDYLQREAERTGGWTKVYAHQQEEWQRRAAELNERIARKAAAP